MRLQYLEGPDEVGEVRDGFTHEDQLKEDAIAFLILTTIAPRFKNEGSGYGTMGA
jgi:hypothetical protein